MNDEKIANMVSRIASVRGRLQAEQRMTDKDFELEIDQLEEAKDELLQYFSSTTDRGDEAS